jgi:hypothetical protein
LPAKRPDPGRVECAVTTAVYEPGVPECSVQTIHIERIKIFSFYDNPLQLSILKVLPEHLPFMNPPADFVV